MPQLTNETQRYYIDTILNEASDRLNDWESSFIDNIATRVYNNIPLSDRQEEILEKIYAEKTK